MYQVAPALDLIKVIPGNNVKEQFQLVSAFR